MDKNVKVAIYARVSTAEQATEGTSTNHQLEQLRGYCLLQGWEVFREYVDAGFSGKDGERPELNHLLTNAKLKLFDKVVVYKLDRLARKLRLLLEIEEKLKEYDISLHSVKETLDTSSAIGRTVFQMLGLVSEWERETIIERTKAGRLQRYREGCWGPGKTPFGYIYKRETKKLVIDKPKARIIQRIFKQYALGNSMSQITNMLNDEKVTPRTKTAKGWHATAVRDVLYNPTYKGTQVVNIYQSYSRLPKEIPEDAIIIKVPRIVDEKTWQIVQEHRKNNKHFKPPRKNQWLLHGLIDCGLCGYTYGTELGHSRRRYYSCKGRCRTKHVDGSERCKAPNLDANWLEQEIWQRIELMINDPNSLSELLIQTIDSLKNREAELNDRIQPINEKLAQIAEQKARLADEWVTLNMNPNKFKEHRQRLENDEARLQTIRTEIDPAQLEELYHTQSIIQLWEKQLQSMSWNVENKDGSMVKVVDKPHKMVLKIIGLENKEISKAICFPATKREILDVLQVRIMVFMDRIEIKSLVLIEPIDCQLFRSTFR